MMTEQEMDELGQQIDSELSGGEPIRLDWEDHQPDLLPVLENLLAEFDAYDRAMAVIGRGHEDYGGQRAEARAAILQAKKGQ